MVANSTDQEDFRSISSLSDATRISTQQVMNFMKSLKMKQNKDLTMENYIVVWRLFNKFLVKLDELPEDWEERASLFYGYLIHQKRKSTTIRSCLSAIKEILKLDNYEWNDNKVLLGSVIWAGRITNDRIKLKFPIHWKVLELIIFEINKIFQDQPYLCCLYKAIMAIGYYRLLRIGELTKRDHSIKARNVHLG